MSNTIVKSKSVRKDKGSSDIIITLSCVNEDEADKLFNDINRNLIEYGSVELNLMVIT